MSFLASFRSEQILGKLIAEQDPASPAASKMVEKLKLAGSKAVPKIIDALALSDKTHTMVLVDILGALVNDKNLKMDVEGAEHDAFDCASQETIDRIDRVAMEYHDNLVPGTLSLLLDRLGGTHSVTVKPVDERGYGILLARHSRLGMAA